MKILGIETSCDETAVCVVEATGDLKSPVFKVLGDALYSKVKTHAEYGGVFPMLAKREHARNIVPLLKKALEEAGIYHPGPSQSLGTTPLNLRGPSTGLPSLSMVLASLRAGVIQKILAREPGLFETTKEILETVNMPDIDAIAVTSGPGLEPALWVGINFARALGVAWEIPVIPTNHMEGHIASVLLNKEKDVDFPAIALLISGGHTELVLVKNWLDYEVVGKTCDDAVGEAFDKVARILRLPYPGGPEISKLAEEARASLPSLSREGMSEGQGWGGIKLPRPMIRTNDLNFSFSGLKTAVLYTFKKYHPGPSQSLGTTPPKLGGVASLRAGVIEKEFALEFENAVADVLVTKSQKAIDQFGAKTFILGGGVSANKHIQNEFKKMIGQYAGIQLLIPESYHSTDNAVMIAVAGYLNILAGHKGSDEITAQGNLSL